MRVCERAGVGTGVAGEGFRVAKQMRGRRTKMKESLHFRQFGYDLKFSFFFNQNKCFFWFFFNPGNICCFSSTHKQTINVLLETLQ